MARMVGKRFIDPGTREFESRANEPILKFFQENSTWDQNTEAYVSRIFPDFFRELQDVFNEAGVARGDVKNASIYGFPVVADTRGRIFAWARGTNDVFLRLRADRVESACRDGARSDPTYPAEWLNFYTLRLGHSWREILKHWIHVSYQDSTNAT